MRKYLRKKVFKVYGLMCHESSFKQRVSHRILISPSLGVLRGEFRSFKGDFLHGKFRLSLALKFKWVLC